MQIGRFGDSLDEYRGRTCIVLSLVPLRTASAVQGSGEMTNQSTGGPTEWRHITWYHPKYSNNHVNTFKLFPHSLAPFFAFTLRSMPPKTRTSQRNRTQDKVPSARTAPSTQVAIPVDASEPQVMIKTNKPTKRARANDTTGNDNDTEVAPPKKKTKAAPQPPLQHDAAPKAKAKAVSEPRETLPERKGRNNNPGVIAKPRIKRTTAQVEADNVAKAEVKRRLEELEEEKKRLYEQMEIDEDEKELERQVKTIRRLSDVIVTNRDATESEGEQFDMDVEASDSDSKDDDTDSKAVRKKKQVSYTDSMFKRSS